MTQNPIALAIAVAFATSIALYGCDSTANLTEQEHIQRAKDFEDKGDIKASIVELKNAVQKNPGSPQARLMLGQIYLKGGLGAEAEKELSQAIKLGVNRELVNPSLGDALLLMGEYKRVLDEIQPTEQASQSNRARILQLRGDALFKLGQFKDACDLYAQSLEIDSNNPPTFWGLAQCSAAERDTVKAREWLDAALKLKDKQASTWILIGGLEQLNRDFEASLSAYDNALKLEPANLEALLGRATLNTSLGRMESAQIDIEKIRKLAPKSLGANYFEALLKFKEEKYSEAQNAVQETLKIAPDYVPALLLGGSIEFALNNLQTAETYLKKALQTSPRNINARRLLAATHVRQGRIDDAEKLLAPIDMVRTNDASLYAIAGEIALAKKDFATAARHFEKAAEISPTNAAIRTDLGIARLGLGDTRAMSDLQAAAGLESPSDRPDNIIILQQLNQKQFDAALASIAKLEKKQGQSPLIWNYRGAAHQGKKEIAKARNSFNAALKLDPLFFPAIANLAQLDLAEGNSAQARKRFESVLKIEPKHLPSMLALADLATMAKDEKAYVNWLEKAAASHPRAIPPRAALARHYLSRKEPQKALALARETVSANPDNPEALNLLGTTQQAAGDTVNAIATFTRLTEKARQSPNAFVQLARVQLAAKNTAAARTTLQKALQLQPDHLPSLEVLLHLELLEGKPESALRTARQIQSQHPASPLGFEREADILLAQKRPQQAVGAYEQALLKGGGSTGVIKLFRAEIMAGNAKQAERRISDWLKQHPKDNAVRVQAAEYYLANGRNKEAIALYSELQRQVPGNVLVLNNLANLYQREKDSRALATAEQAYKLAPDNPIVQDTLGWILVEQGEAKRGLELLRKALAKAPKAASLRYHHAVALARTGKTMEARKELEKLLKETPEFPEAEAARAFMASL